MAPKNEPALRSILCTAVAMIVGCTHTTQSDDARDATREETRIDRSDLPLTHATEDELTRFALGDELFDATFRAADGLGPLYVRASCSACHRDDGRGPGRVAKVVGVDIDEQASAALLPFGATERPYVAGYAKQPLLAPKADARLRVVFRFPPAVFGRGYLEAVDDAEIEKLALAASTRTGAIRGRIHYVTNASGKHIGRFGLKARIATLEEFTADAFHSDMGITSPLHPEEAVNPEAIDDDDKQGVDVSSQVLTQVSDYVRMLEIPTRKPDVQRGAEHFARAQCSTCHVPTLATRKDFPVRALAGIDAPVYTDLLLHDMGAGLADGPREGDASAREWRTAPLIGLRFFRAFMHDGRAKSIAEAVLAHASEGSEASESVARFSALEPTQRDELLRFVSSL